MGWWTGNTDQNENSKTSFNDQLTRQNISKIIKRSQNQVKHDHRETQYDHLSHLTRDLLRQKSKLLFLFFFNYSAAPLSTPFDSFIDTDKRQGHGKRVAWWALNDLFVKISYTWIPWCSHLMRATHIFLSNNSLYNSIRIYANLFQY